MAILQTDIKLMNSERMHDSEDGGGRMSGDEIVDGASNNMFPDVSQLDRTYGRLNLRKTFEAVLSDTTDTFFGSNVIISKPPSDDTIHCTLFRSSTSDSAWVDERYDAKNKIESYITLGQLSSMVLLGQQYEGQRAILVYQRTTSTLPQVGEIYALLENDIYQFVRVTNVSVTLETYTDSQGDFSRNEITLEISDPLMYEFTGGTPHRDSSYQPPCTLHKTNGVPSVSYYGIQKLAEEAAFGERSIKVESYKGHLLPATQSEEALLDVNVSNTTSFVDNSLSSGRDVTVIHTQVTTAKAVTISNRGYTYVAQLIPKPKPKTVSVFYRSQERWYTLSDDAGDGQLQGDGSGSINYATGSISLTLADMPDVDTAILFGWGTGTELERFDTGMVVNSPTYTYNTVDAPIVPSSLTITWDSGNKTATDDGHGNIRGDALGTVDYTSGKVDFTSTTLLAPADQPEITYTKKEEVVETFENIQVDQNTGMATLQLSQTPEDNSLSISYTLHAPEIRYTNWDILYRWLDGDNLGTYDLHSGDTPMFRAKDQGDGTLTIGDGTVDKTAKTVTFDTIIPYEYKYKIIVGYN